MKQIKTNLKLMVIAILSILTYSCTDLEVEETDSAFEVGDDGEFSGVSDVDGAINGLYGAIYGQIGNQADLYALNEVTSDELLVPTRGTDWGDNGLWRDLHAQTYSSIHPFVLAVWNNLNQNIFTATTIIDPLTTKTASQEADARFLRAWSMFWIADMYGQQPFRQPNEPPSVTPVVLTRAESVDFIIEDLEFAIQNLPTRGPSADNNRANKSAARYLLAKVLLNKNIYLDTSPDTADMTRVVTLVDAINTDGFDLQSGYFDIFKEETDNETIWFAQTGVGNRIWNGMHYFQNSPDNGGGGWNGWTTLAEFYDLFEGDPNTNVSGSGQEERRGFVPDATNAGPDNLGIGYGFLIGQQYDTNGEPLTDRPGNPLVFTKELPGLVGNNEVTGIRTIKYHPVNGSFTNHEIVFRYADAHLMKAEAILRGASGDATAAVNELRLIRGATPLGTVTEQDMLDERGRELYKEFWRRQDLIRFGKYNDPWGYKEASDPTVNVFPIPATAILSNPNLTQNPGY